MEKNTGKVREFCHPGKVGTLQVTTIHPFSRTNIIGNET